MPAEVKVTLPAPALTCPTATPPLVSVMKMLPPELFALRVVASNSSGTAALVPIAPPVVFRLIVLATKSAMPSAAPGPLRVGRKITLAAGRCQLFLRRKQCEPRSQRREAQGASRL